MYFPCFTTNECQEVLDEESTDEEIQSYSQTCIRCGRDSHDVKNCYATVDVNGQFIDDSEEDETKPQREYCVDKNDIFYNRGWTDLTEKNVLKIKETPGVYEIAQIASGKEPICTYVGHSGNLLERLLVHFHGFCYTHDGNPRGSNIKKMKEDAEERGYRIAFRYRKYETKEIAECNEQALLMTFCYAWNLMDNEKEDRRSI
eukprot:gene12786-7058_t